MNRPEPLAARVSALFPENADVVWALVEEFMAEIDDKERETVVHAVLELSEGNATDLERLLKVAARDYREVLVMVAEGGSASR